MARFVTHGCRLNLYETEAMERLAAAAGVAGAVVLNSCAVTAEATRKSRREARRLARLNPGAPVVVTGCAAQIDPAGFAAMPGVAHVLGNAEKLRPEVWEALARGGAPRGAVADIMAAGRPAAPPLDGFGRHRAHVAVQNGCDHRCTFCIIPYGRGNSRSLSADRVVDEVARLVGRGFAEVVLTGVDLTSWGADLEGGPRLGALVGAVLRGVPGLARLRLSSLDAVEADPLLLEAIATEPRLMPHLHLSLQAGDDLVLKRMKRRHRRDEAVALCAELRRLRPGIALGADLIAGFPTETEAMFANTLALVADCGLAFLHVFPYSPRPGTPAARMPQVAPAVIRERAARLRAAGEGALARHLAGLVGTRQRLLAEGPRRARSEGFAEVALSADRTPGSLFTLTVTGHDGRRLCA